MADWDANRWPCLWFDSKFRFSVSRHQARIQRNWTSSHIWQIGPNTTLLTCVGILLFWHNNRYSFLSWLGYSMWEFIYQSYISDFVDLYFFLVLSFILGCLSAFRESDRESGPSSTSRNPIGTPSNEILNIYYSTRNEIRGVGMGDIRESNSRSFLLGTSNQKSRLWLADHAVVLQDQFLFLNLRAWRNHLLSEWSRMIVCHPLSWNVPFDKSISSSAGSSWSSMLG